MRRIIVFVLAAVRAALAGVAAALDHIARLFGGGRPPVQTPPPALTSDEVREEYVGAYEREAAADADHASDLGQAVHQYASAEDPRVRCAVDLGGLKPAQMDWLLGLRDEDLCRLAQAGPTACERAVAGKRSGIVGLPMPAIESAAHQFEGPHPVRNLLADRIRSARTRDADLLA